MGHAHPPIFHQNPILNKVQECTSPSPFPGEPCSEQHGPKWPFLFRAGPPPGQMARSKPPRDPWNRILNEVRGVSSSWESGGRPAGQKHPRCSEYSLPPRLHGPATPPRQIGAHFEQSSRGFESARPESETPPRLKGSKKIPQKSKKKTVLHITTVGKSSSRNAFLSGSQRHFGVRQKIDKFVKEILESRHLPTGVGCVLECCIGWIMKVGHQ